MSPTVFVGQTSDQRVHLHIRGDEILNFETWPEMRNRVLKHKNGLVLDTNTICLRVFSKEPENNLYFDKFWNPHLKDSKGSIGCNEIISGIYKCPGYGDSQFYTPRDGYWAIQQALLYEENPDGKDWPDKEKEFSEKEGKRGLLISHNLFEKVKLEETQRKEVG